MTTEKWEIDVQEMTLDDLEILEAGLKPGASATQIKETLGRLVTNKTPEDIGKIPLKQLNEHIVQLNQTIAELSIPKEKATP